MATKRTPRIIDPAQVANQKILRDRQARIDKQQEIETASAVDLGLEIPEPEPETAAEFLADAFDKRNFAGARDIPTFTKVVYGPDPLLENPAFKESIEKNGLEAFAEATAQAILNKGAAALPDKLMQRALGQAIKRFGVEKVAEAFAQRVMKIPSRTVEIEADREDELFGKPLEEAAAIYGRPGMALKFLSPRCIDVLGMRGYVLVKDERGENAKVGTLLVAEIPQRIADRRREHFADESRKAVRDAEETFEDNIERELARAGRVGAGSRPLRRDEVISAAATEDQGYLGQQRTAGVSFEDGSF